MYHILDVLRLVWHRGYKNVFWAGSDIKNLNWFTAQLVRCADKHVCENSTEHAVLLRLGINAEIRQMFFDDASQFKVSFKPSTRPHVYLTCHPGRHKEYGVDLIESIAHKVLHVTFHVYGIRRPYHEIWHDPLTGEVHNLYYYCPENVVYHGKVSNKQFNEEIQNYQAALRLNEFDGFSETIAKSLLMGQYPISRIGGYPLVPTFFEETGLLNCLEKLSEYTKPNQAARDYWFPKLSTTIYPL